MKAMVGFIPGNLWILLAPPAIWGGHFLLCYITAAIWHAKKSEPWESFDSLRIALAIGTVAAWAILGVLGRLSWHHHRSASMEQPTVRFLCFLTLLLTVISAVAVFYSALVLILIPIRAHVVAA